MKHRIFNILIILLISVGLAGITAAPAGAQNAVTIDSITALPDKADRPARYEIVFTVSAIGALAVGVDTIYITFPLETQIPSNIQKDDVSVNGVNCDPNGDVFVSDHTLTIIPGIDIAGSSQCTVIIRQSAGIVNPQLSRETGDNAPDDLYVLTVATNKDAADTIQYEIFDWVGAYPRALAQHALCTVWGAGFAPNTTIHLNGLSGGPVHGSGIVGEDGTFEFVGYATGKFDLNLQAIDGSGRSAEVVGDEPSLGPNQSPSADFTYSPDEPVARESITFDASDSTDPDGKVISWSWDFGDGNKGSGKTVTHSYSSGDDYAVTLTITDNRGATDTIGKTMSVAPSAEPETNTAPTAEAGPPVSVEQSSPRGATAILDGSASRDPDGDMLAYNWTWPDGSASGIQPSAVFPPGATTVILIVSDGDLTDTDNTIVTVADTTPPEVIITSPENGKTYPSTRAPITVQYVKIDLCDPAPALVVMLDGTEFNGTEINLKTMSSGEHTITITATDASGNSASASASFAIEAQVSKIRATLYWEYVLLLLKFLISLPFYT
jgi:hypothetical protein